jgi:methionine-rich copper-binding protein CopC
MLRKLIPSLAALGALALSSCAPVLAAKPHLVAVWPRSGASLSVARHTFQLTFNRPLSPESSSAVVWGDERGGPLAVDVRIDPTDSERLKVRLLEPSIGTYELHWHAVTAQSGASADGDLAFNLQNESPAPPRIDVSPATTDKGEVLELVGKGFGKHARVQLSMADDEQSLGSVETDERGTFNFEAHVPASVPFGVQPVVAVDDMGRTATAAVRVHWGGWPPVVATALGQPGPDTGEVTFTVNVRNGSDYVLEHVRVVLKNPEGGSLVGADPAPQTEEGTLVWMIPVMDRELVGPFRATFRTSAPVVAHAWMEYRHRHSRNCGLEECLPAFISDASADSPPVAPAD